MAECAYCKGLGYLERPNVDLLRRNTVWDMLMRCPHCTSEQDRERMQASSGLEHPEQGRMLDDWRIPALSPEHQIQRRKAKTLIGIALEYRCGLFTFWGDFGSGKTMALQITINELRAKGIAGHYTPMATILEHLRSTYSRHEETGPYWTRLLEIPALAIDEVTRFNATDWAQEKLFELVDTRYRRKTSHLTLLATNDDPRIALPVGEALGYLYSRMREGHLCELRGDVRKIVQAGTN